MCIRVVCDVFPLNDKIVCTVAYVNSDFYSNAKNVCITGTTWADFGVICDILSSTPHRSVAI